MEPTLAPLLNIGAVGAVLAWFLFQTNPRLDRIETAINRLTKAQMLTLISREDVTELVKSQARQVLREIEGRTPSKDLSDG